MAYPLFFEQGIARILFELPLTLCPFIKVEFKDMRFISEMNFIIFKFTIFINLSTIRFQSRYE